VQNVLKWRTFELIKPKRRKVYNRQIWRRDTPPTIPRPSINIGPKVKGQGHTVKNCKRRSSDRRELCNAPSAQNLVLPIIFVT